MYTYRCGFHVTLACHFLIHNGSLFSQRCIHDRHIIHLPLVKNLAVAVVVGAVVVAYLWLETNSLVLGISQLTQRISHVMTPTSNASV